MSEPCAHEFEIAGPGCGGHLVCVHCGQIAGRPDWWEPGYDDAADEPPQEPEPGP